MDYFSVFDKKMSEILSFRSDSSDGPDAWAWGYRLKSMKTTESRPQTLKEYYNIGSTDLNSPFSLFTIRGEHSWQNSDNQLKLKDVGGGGDGAAKLVVKPAWRVKLKIRTAYSDALILLGDASGITLANVGSSMAKNRGGDAVTNVGRIEGIQDSYPNIIWTSEPDGSTRGRGSEGETWVILDGDMGDYIAFDIDSEHGDIGNIVIQSGGARFNQTDYGRIDKAGDDNWVKIALEGVYYKPSEYGESGKITDYKGHYIMHDAGNMRIYAENMDSGEAVTSASYAGNTDAKAVYSYIMGTIDRLNGGVYGDYDEDGCPPNSTYNEAKSECVCNEGFMTDLFGLECVDIALQQSEDPKGCPPNSNVGVDNYCHCNSGYVYREGVCVLDERSQDEEPLNYGELVEKYAPYALLGLGALTLVTILSPKN